jgi:hypothetical protein
MKPEDIINRANTAFMVAKGGYDLIRHVRDDLGNRRRRDRSPGNESYRTTRARSPREPPRERGRILLS